MLAIWAQYNALSTGTVEGGVECAVVRLLVLQGRNSELEKATNDSGSTQKDLIETKSKLQQVGTLHSSHFTILTLNYNGATVGVTVGVTVAVVPGGTSSASIGGA